MTDLQKNTSHWLTGLNPEQQRAVLHDQGPLLILAGAGSGKTTVLVSRAGRLIEEGKVCPSELLVLTFTNKAARELKERVARRLGKASQKIWAGTFHSFGLYLLRKYYRQAGLPKQFGILDPKDCSSLVKELLKSFTHGTKSAFDVDKLLFMMAQWRELGQTKSTSDDEYGETVEWLLPNYLKKLSILGMVDFDSLILKPTELLENFPEIASDVQNCFKQVMLDEFQDTSVMQMRFVKNLVKAHQNIVVVGDDDQSIYGWRGACINNILDFPKRYQNCEVIRLERNYRSTPAILKVANAVIAKNAKRHGKTLKAEKTDDLGTKPELMVFEDESEEAESVITEIDHQKEAGFRLNEIAVLYRSNSQGALLEAELRNSSVPYAISGGTAFFDRTETRDILAFLIVATRSNDVALRRVLNVPSRGIGDKTIEKIQDFADERSTSFTKAIAQWRNTEVDPDTGEKIDAFFEMVKSWIPKILEAAEPGMALKDLLLAMGYKKHLSSISKDEVGAAHRWRFVEIFTDVLSKYIAKGARDLKTLGSFLEAMSLRDSPSSEDKEVDKVQLMTLHACKGLEFPVVIMVGIEEDILPHKTLGSDVSEERRLFYVGVTRAMQHLILTRTKQRRRNGRVVSAIPSRFLLEIPAELLERRKGPRPVREEKRQALLAALYAKLPS